MYFYEHGEFPPDPNRDGEAAQAASFIVESIRPIGGAYKTLDEAGSVSRTKLLDVKAAPDVT